MHVQFREDRKRVKAHLGRTEWTARGPRRQHIAVLGWLPVEADAFRRLVFWQDVLATLADLETSGVLTQATRYDVIDQVSARYPLPRLDEARAIRRASELAARRTLQAEGRWSDLHEAAAALKDAAEATATSKDALEGRPEAALFPLLAINAFDEIGIAKQIAKLHCKTRAGLSKMGLALADLRVKELARERAYWARLVRLGRNAPTDLPPMALLVAAVESERRAFADSALTVARLLADGVGAVEPAPPAEADAPPAEADLERV